jgi:hypothetical protein
VDCKFLKTLVIALGALLCCSLPALGGPNASARIVIDYDAYTPLIDDECPDMGEESDIVLSVLIRGVKDLDGYALLVSYNKETLSFVSAKKRVSGTGQRAFLEENGGRAGVFLVKPGEGSADIAASLIGTDREEAPDGDGIIAYVQFKRIKEGNCGIKIAEAEVIDSGLITDKIISLKKAKKIKIGKDGRKKKIYKAGEGNSQ